MESLEPGPNQLVGEEFMSDYRACLELWDDASKPGRPSLATQLAFKRMASELCSLREAARQAGLSPRPLPRAPMWHDGSVCNGWSTGTQ